MLEGAGLHGALHHAEGGFARFLGLLRQSRLAEEERRRIVAVRGLGGRGGFERSGERTQRVARLGKRADSGGVGEQRPQVRAGGGEGYGKRLPVRHQAARVGGLQRGAVGELGAAGEREALESGPPRRREVVRKAHEPARARPRLFGRADREQLRIPQGPLLSGQSGQTLSRSMSSERNSSIIGRPNHVAFQALTEAFGSSPTP